MPVLQCMSVATDQTTQRHTPEDLNLQYMNIAQSLEATNVYGRIMTIDDLYENEILTICVLWGTET